MPIPILGYPTLSNISWLTIRPHIPFRKSLFVCLRLAWRAAMNELQSLCLGGHIMNISPQSLTPPMPLSKGLIFRNQHELKVWFMWFNPSRHNKKKRLEISSSTWKAHWSKSQVRCISQSKIQLSGLYSLLRPSILLCIDIFLTVYSLSLELLKWRRLEFISVFTGWAQSCIRRDRVCCFTGLGRRLGHQHHSFDNINLVGIRTNR